MRDISEATAPATIPDKPLLEADVQEQCVDWARRRGWWARKFSSISQRSVPDYLFAKWHVHVSKLTGDYVQTRSVRLKFWTEFKREGHERDAKGLMSTTAQQDEQKLMVEAGWIGFECDNFEHFKREVERIELTGMGDA